MEFENTMSDSEGKDSKENPKEEEKDSHENAKEEEKDSKENPEENEIESQENPVENEIESQENAKEEEKDSQENPEEQGETTDVHATAQPNLKATAQPDVKTSDARGNKEAEAKKTLQTKPDRTDENRPETAILASTRLRRSGKGNVSQGAISFGDQRELILVIRGIVERIVLPEDQSIVLGRSDARLRYHADVDLTPYGALDRGVSREHSRVYTEDGHLYIVDMNSTNGTFLSGKRLEPNIPALLHKGDELLLGRLPVQILFR